MHTRFKSRPCSGNKKSFKLITVGSLEQLYKGTDMLIDAVAKCVQHGYDLKLTIVGSGKHKSELEDRARARGLGKRVHFTGEMPSGDAVRLIFRRGRSIYFTVAD